MNTQLIEKVHSDQMKKVPEIMIGDTVKLHIRISEGDKSRIQVFEGIVLSMKGTGLDSMITVRKVSSGIGVEKIFPLHAPTLEKIEVVKRGKVRRSKLYYMRERVGRKAMKISGSKIIQSEEVEDVKTENVENDAGTDSAEDPTISKEVSNEKEQSSPKEENEVKEKKVSEDK